MKERGIQHSKPLTEEQIQIEKKHYKGSFNLFDEKKGLGLVVPCYDDKLIYSFPGDTKSFPELKEFDADNDVNTDEEQKDLEEQRVMESLTNFVNCAKKEEN